MQFGKPIAVPLSIHFSFAHLLADVVGLGQVDQVHHRLGGQQLIGVQVVNVLGAPSAKPTHTNTRKGGGQGRWLV